MTDHRDDLDAALHTQLDDVLDYRGDDHILADLRDDIVELIDGINHHAGLFDDRTDQLAQPKP